MEIWDAYDRQGTKAGTDLIRGEEIGEGLYHLVCEVVVRHVDGDYLLLQRDFRKEAYPGFEEIGAGGERDRGRGAGRAVPHCERQKPCNPPRLSVRHGRAEDFRCAPGGRDHRLSLDRQGGADRLLRLGQMHFRPEGEAERIPGFDSVRRPEKRPGRVQPGRADWSLLCILL